MVKRRYFDEEPFRNTQIPQRRAFYRLEVLMIPQIRLATEADSALVAALIVAMAAHYGDPGGQVEENAAAAMVQTTLATREGTQFLLAFADPGAESEPVGIAFFVVIRPGRNLKGLIYLKDLFVPAAHRGRGIGRSLMAALADYASTHDIGRIDLRTDSANTGAQRLYETLGGTRLEKVSYSFDPRVLKGNAEIS
jgi:ribosomal protein S18 acetylase RimI-like enzyme